jgi:hypothetical protein
MSMQAAILSEREVVCVPDPCITFRFSTAGVSEPARAEAVRDLHLRERRVLPAGLEPLEPLSPACRCD